MPRRERPAMTERSEHWLRFAVAEQTDLFNDRIKVLFGWPPSETIEWLSPIRSDDFAEYYDREFLSRAGISALDVPLHDFWPASGPRWDGLAKTASNKIILVEAKAYIGESVSFLRAKDTNSIDKIRAAFVKAKKAFRATAEVGWERPFYQHANRLAHLYFLRGLNRLDANLLFLYFADAPDVPKSDFCTAAQWEGAIKLTDKALGLGAHAYEQNVKSLIWSVPELLGGK